MARAVLVACALLVVVSSQYSPLPNEQKKSEFTTLQVEGQKKDEIELKWGSEEVVEGMKISVYVVALLDEPKTKDRLNEFRQQWNNAWPTADVTVIPGVRHQRRGYGLTMSFKNLLRQAMKDGCDYCVVFEDDARPFKGTEWPKDLMTSLREGTHRSNSQWTVMLLGAHNITYKGEAKAPITQLATQAWGTYGWAVPVWNIPSLYDQWERDTNMEGDEPLCPDKSWTSMWTDSHPAYIATPLLVDHPSGWSANWGKERELDWAGQAEWYDVANNAKKVGLVADTTKGENLNLEETKHDVKAEGSVSKHPWVGVREWWSISGNAVQQPVDGTTESKPQNIENALDGIVNKFMGATKQIIGQ